MPRTLFPWMCWIVVAIAWVLAVRVLAYRFFHASNFAAQLLSACGLAVLFLWLRQRERLLYGVLECLAAGWLLNDASGIGRGPFSPEFSPDFARFDPRAITLQSYGGLLLLIDGLNNAAEGWATWPPHVAHLLWTAQRFPHWLGSRGRGAPPSDDPPIRTGPVEASAAAPRWGEMDMTFDIKTPADLFERVLLPTYRDFLANNASSRHALQATLVAYHLFDWANKKGFTDEAFRQFYPQPEHGETLKYFQIARGLANGFKHFESPLPGQAHTGPRVVTSTQTGFSSEFTEEFARPLNAEDVSVDFLLQKLVAFWTDQHAKGALR